MQQFKTILTSEHKLFDLHIRETFKYRDLIFLFVKREFVAMYKQTILGPAWAIVQPLLTTIVFTLIFGNIAGLTTADTQGDYALPGFLFYMSGNICWSYFSGTLNTTSNTFLSNSNIMGKVYYPRLVAPISSAFSNLISFGIQLALFFCFLLYYLIRGGTSIQITPMCLLIPLLIIHMMVLSIGFGIIISSITTKYRDLAMLVSFGLSLWQYATPIVYGLELINSKLPQGLQALYMLNPMTPIITSFRFAVFGFGYFNLHYYLLSWGFSIIVFFIGVVMFSRIERTFMDTI